MAVAEMDTGVPEEEIRRHEAYWKAFVRFMTFAAVGSAIVLGAMAIFLL